MRLGGCSGFSELVYFADGIIRACVFCRCSKTSFHVTRRTFFCSLVLKRNEPHHEKTYLIANAPHEDPISESESSMYASGNFA